MPDRTRALHTGHRARMREKFINYGRDIFHTHELLEMLLFYAVPQRNTNDTAKLLLERFGTLDGVFSAAAEELAEVNGVGDKVSQIIGTVGKISLSKAKSELAECEKSTTAGKFFAEIFKNDKTACTAIILLGNKMSLLEYKTFNEEAFMAGIGTETFVDAVISSRASAAVVACRKDCRIFQNFEEISKSGKLSAALSGVGALLLECYSVSDTESEVMQNGPDVKFSLPDITREDEKQRIFELLFPISKEAVSLTEKLLKYFPSFANLADTDIGKINKITGETTTSLYIKLVSALVSRRYTDAFRFGKKYTYEEIGEYLKALFFGLSDEAVYVISLDCGGKIISCDKAGEGSVNATAITSRRILEICKKHSAKSVIIAHNHPGGKALASEEDISAGNFLSEVLTSAGITLSCQYIVSGIDFIRI